MMIICRPRTPLSILALVALGWGLFAAVAPAQNRLPSGLAQPLLYQVSPAGARAGTTVEISVSGRDLEGAEKLVFSRPGIKAEFVPEAKPKSDPKAKTPGKRRRNAGPMDTLKFKVTVPANTALGNCDLRLVNKWGISNARAFQIGDLKEVLEVEPNNEDTKAQRLDLNTTVNGGFAGPQDVDYYVVHAAKGVRVVVSCLSSTVDSRANPAVEIYNKDDKQIASNNNYRDSDALADFVAAEEGDFLIRVIQFAHTFRQPISGGMPPGSSDHFYRLSVTTAPWIDAVFPSVVEPGKATKVTVYGRNLPGGKVDPNAVVDENTLESATVDVTAPADSKGKLAFSGIVLPATGWLDGFELRLKNASGSSNPFLLGVATAPVVLDNGNNDTPATAQAVTLPCEIAGRIEKRRDRDWYSFEAKKGDVYTFSVNSNKLGAPTYMKLILRSATAKNNLHESPLVENMQGYSRKFFSRSEDPVPYRLVVPADGKYFLLVSSRSGDSLFGPRHTYSLKISHEAPDFRLVAMPVSDSRPEASQLPAGGQGAFSVLIERVGGFTDDVELSVEGLPPGATCSPQVLSGNVRKATLIVNAPAEAADWIGEVRVKGTATIKGTKVAHEARPAGIVWPVQPGQNTPTLSRVESGLWLAVRGKAPFTMTPTADKPPLVQGGKGTIKVKINRLSPDLKNPISVGLTQSQNQPNSELPNNLRINNNQPLNVAKDKNEATFNVTIGQDVPPGLYNVVFRGQTQVAYAKDPTSKTKPNTNVVAFSTPLTIFVLPKTLATVQLSSGNPTVKIGGQAELTVRIQRKFNYAGEFKVNVVLPGGEKGLDIAEVTIPAEQNEAKLLIKAPGDAKPGNRQNLIVKATALFGASKVPVVQETKFSVNVVK